MTSAFPRTRTIRVAIVLLLAGAAGGAVFLFRQRHLAAVRAALPAPPLAGASAALREQLAAAQAQAAHGDPAAIATLGRLYHANGFAREAGECWRVLVREQPGDARWRYYLADLRRHAGDQAGAEAELSATVALDASYSPAWLQLAEMKLKSGRADAAESDYQRRLALLPGDPYATLGLARIAELRGRRPEAMALLESAIKHHPKFSAAHNLYAELQAADGNEAAADLHRWLGRDAGRFREAEDPWLDELNAACLESRRLTHLGTIAYQTGRGDLGRAQFEKAIVLAPGDPLAYQLLGELLLEKGETAKAREFLESGIARASVAPPTPAHYIKLSEAWMAQQKPVEARDALTAGLARHPDAAELHLAWGNWLARNDHPAEAAEAYRRALTLNPSLAEADFALATLLLQQGRRDEAVAALQHAREMQPTFPKALLLLARLEMDAGRLDRAGDYLLPLLKANPGVPEIRSIVARWHQQRGRAVEKRDPMEAERRYRAGLALVADDAALNADLGALLLFSGRVEPAVAALEIAWRASSSEPQLALLLGQAYARTGRLSDAREVLTAGLRQAEQRGQAGTVRNFREILSALPQ